MSHFFPRAIPALVLCGALLSGCAAEPSGSAVPAPSFSVSSESMSSALESSSAFSSSSSSPEASLSSAAPAAPTREELEELVDKNFYLMTYVFILGSLPTENESVEFKSDADWIQKVKSDEFPDYKTFEEYVRSVYCKKTADMYLYDYPYEGDPKYLDRDGELYVNLKYDGGKGYYADLQHYTVTVGESDGETCAFTVATTVEWPADKPVKEPYLIEGKALLEDGGWVLEDMIS